MIVWNPARGLGDFPWLSDWTSSGRNDGGEILRWVLSDNADQSVRDALSESTGKSIPYGGGALSNTAWAPVLFTYGPHGALGLIYLDQASRYGVPPQFANSWFVHPGDDVMAAAIHKWVGDSNPAIVGPAPFSQAIDVVGGQTAAQAAQIAAINAQSLAQATAADGGNQLATAAGAGNQSAAGAGNQSAAGGSTPAASGLAAIPMWAWLAGAAVAVWFAMKGQNG